MKDDGDSDYVWGSDAIATRMLTRMMMVIEYVTQSEPWDTPQGFKELWRQSDQYQGPEYMYMWIYIYMCVCVIFVES